MSHSQVAVLDFGSSKITVLVGIRSKANTLRIMAKGMSDYAGFMDGEFLEPSTLKDSIHAAINEAQEMLGKKIKRIYIGAPAEFCYNQTVPLDLFFTKKTRIKEKHISKMFMLHKDKIISNTHTIVNQSAIFYKLDDGIKTPDPINADTTSLHSYTSFVLADNEFINLVSQAITEIGITSFEFISGSLSESLYLLQPEQRVRGAILIDCGYITTSIMHILGEGLLDLKSFSLGGGHITSDLSELMKVPFVSAEQLKRKIVLSLQAKPKDYYEAVVDNRLSKFSAKTINDIALARIDMIGEGILASLSDFSNVILPSTKVYLTGGGIAYIKGIRDYLSKYINYDIDILAPQPLQYNKPDLSTEIALLEVALDTES